MTLALVHVALVQSRVGAWIFFINFVNVDNLSRPAN